MKHKLWLSLCVVAAMVSPATQAVTAYVGGGAGFGEVQDFCTTENQAFCDDEGGLLRGFAGLRFTDYFALEADLDMLVGLKAPGARFRGLDGDTDVITVSINALGFIPLGERIWLYTGLAGGVSVVSTDTSEYDGHDERAAQQKDWDDDDWDDDDWDSDSDRDSEYESDAGFAIAGLLGVEVKFGEDIRGRVQWQHWNDIDGERAFYGKRDVDLYSANFVWMF